ncbi:MAG: HDOD domain-containing protein [bacterium]|mgnify:CR=1 FL=1|nr:HDOD domain-containing protein [bacterium]
MTQSTQTTSKSPLSWLLPANKESLEQLKSLLTDTRTSIDIQANAVLKDPVIALDIIKVANSMALAGSKTVITTIRGALQRLGNKEVADRLTSIAERPEIETPGVSDWIEIYRDHCRKISQVTGIVASIKRIPFVEECRLSSVFTFLGDMLAAGFLREEYVVQAHGCTRKVLNYRLSQKYHFDPEQTLIKYLQKNGVPEILIFPLDRKASTNDPRGAAIRPICTAAQELFEGYVNNKWDRYKDQQTLPTSSLVKVLQLTEPQYSQMIEEINVYLAPPKKP